MRILGIVTHNTIHLLGGGFKDFIIFTQKLGKMKPLLTSIFFQMGWCKTTNQQHEFT